MNQRVDRAERLARGCGFSVPNVIGIVQELTLQVGEVDRIVVRDAEPPHACCGQIQRRRGSESTGTDDQDACALQSALTVLTDFIESDVPTVSDKLFRRERIVGGGNLGRRVRWYHAGRGLGRMIGEETPIYSAVPAPSVSHHRPPGTVEPVPTQSRISVASSRPRGIETSPSSLAPPRRA